MTHDIDTLTNWLRWVLGFAAFFTTAFPALWLFSKWNDTPTGILLMFQTATFALVLDVTMLFQFWHPGDILVIFWANAILFSLVAASSACLTGLLWKHNYHDYFKRKFQKKHGEDDKVESQ